MSMQARIVEEALSWEGTPYHHQACIKGAGVDCAMFLVAVYQALGLVPKDFDPRPYPVHWHLHRGEQRFLNLLLQYAEPVETPEPGDIAMFSYGYTDSHGSIVIEWPHIIHAYCGEGCVRADASKGDLAKRFAGAYRLREIR